LEKGGNMNCIESPKSIQKAWKGRTNRAKKTYTGLINYFCWPLIDDHLALCCSSPNDSIWIPASSIGTEMDRQVNKKTTEKVDKNANNLKYQAKRTRGCS
jgi:hypothetical protein